MPKPADHLSGRSLQVELDAFSGQPNPRWDLAPADGEAFLTALRALRPERAGARAPDGLGYRGIVVRTNGEEIRLYRGMVFARRGGRVDVFADPERALERGLIRSAPAPLSQMVLSIAASEGLP